MEPLRRRAGGRLPDISKAGRADRVSPSRTAGFGTRSPCESAATGRLALGVLRSLTSPLQAVLLPLLHPRVTGEEAGLAEDWLRGLIGLHEGARRGMHDRAGLAGDPAALNFGQDVVGTNRVRQAERQGNRVLVGLPGEALLDRNTVDDDVARPWLQEHLGDAGLAPSDRGELIRRRSAVPHALVSSFLGADSTWPACGCSGPV